MITGGHDRDTNFALGLLGPMRMDYERAIASLHSIKNELIKALEGLV